MTQQRPWLRKTPIGKDQKALQQQTSQPPNINAVEAQRLFQWVPFQFGKRLFTVDQAITNVCCTGVIHCSDGPPYHAFTYVHGTSPEATDKADQAPRHRPLLSLSSVTSPRVLFQRLVFSLPLLVF